MQTVSLVLLVIALIAFLSFSYRTRAEKRAREKKRNQYHDRM